MALPAKKKWERYREQIQPLEIEGGSLGTRKWLPPFLFGLLCCIKDERFRGGAEEASFVERKFAVWVHPLSNKFARMENTNWRERTLWSGNNGSEGDSKKRDQSTILGKKQYGEVINHAYDELATFESSFDETKKEKNVKIRHGQCPSGEKFLSLYQRDMIAIVVPSDLGGRCGWQKHR